MAKNTGLTVQQVNTILSYAGAKDIKRTPFKTSFVMNGKRYAVTKETAADKFNIYDVIATLQRNAVSTTDIAKILNKSQIPPISNAWKDDPALVSINQMADNYNSNLNNKIQGNTITKAYWSAKTVQTEVNAAAPEAYRYIVDKINQQDPNAKAYAYRLQNPDGSSYYTIRYINKEGNSVPYQFKDTDLTKLDKGSLDEWYKKSDLNQSISNDIFQAQEQQKAAEELNNRINAAQGSLNLSNAALAALRGSVGSGANAYQDMSAADRAAVTAKLPGTSGLTAYNKLNGVDIVPNITGNQDISGTIQRRALAELMGLGDQVLDENDDVRQRNIRTQQSALLQQIRQDPELYNALVQRFRADSAAGVTAGQRAANAGDVVNQSQAGYTEAAQNLYDSLFKPDGEIAKTRDEALSTQQTALDQYITGQLNNARKDAVDAGTQATDLRTAIGALSEVFGVDVSKQANDILESSAATDTKASDILARIAGNSQTALANQDAALQQILNTYNLGNNLASTGASGSTDVSNALGVIMQALQKPASTWAGFKTVSTPDYEKAKQFNNQQYNDVLNSKYMDYLDPDVIKRMGSSKSLDDILSEYGLDMLSEEGLKTLYTQYAEDANKRSDKVFNAAQRAYIAAITAGDAKTSEQLTRLAQNTSGARSNLYASEALANQFRQQRANANTGLQMATDVQNQRSANANAVNKAALQANSALSNYLGTGADGYDKSTLYAIGSLWDQAAAANRQSYVTLSNSIMQGIQNMNTQNVQNSVNNANRLAQLAAGITSANAAAAANNAANTASRNTAITQAQASKTQAERDLEKLTKLK